MKYIFSKLIFNILNKLHKPHDDLSFLPERMKTGNVEMPVTTLHDKT